MAKNSQFQFGTIDYKTVRSREIGSNAPPQRVGVNSVFTVCNCGHAWTARAGAGLDAVIGGVSVTCPECKASAHVSGRELGV